MRGGKGGGGQLTALRPCGLKRIRKRGGEGGTWTDLILNRVMTGIQKVNLLLDTFPN